MPELMWPAFVVFSGYVLLGLTGFGSALVIVPLLSWHWPLPHVVALVLLLDLPMCLVQGGLNHRQVQWREVRLLLPGMVLGSVLGLWLVQVLEPRWPLIMLGLYVVVIGLRQLRNAPTQPRKIPDRLGWLAGGAAGVVEMMFGTAGPVLTAWLRMRLDDVMQLRVTAPILIACSACIVLGGMGMAGKLSTALLWQHWLWLLGAALLGTLAGDRLAHRLPRALLARAMAVVLILCGLSLFKAL